MRGTCSFCEFFAADRTEGGSTGQCRYGAPPRWPSVLSTDWCGRFREIAMGPPKGRYRASIVRSGIEGPNGAKYLRLVWKIEGGAFDGCEAVQILRLWHDDPHLRAALELFTEVRRATGRMAPRDFSELHGIPCLVTMGAPVSGQASSEIVHVAPASARA